MPGHNWNLTFPRFRKRGPIEAPPSAISGGAMTGIDFRASESAAPLKLRGGDPVGDETVPGFRASASAAPLKHQPEESELVPPRQFPRFRKRRPH